MCILSFLPCSPMSMLTLRFYPEKPGQRKGLLQTPQRGLVASIHSIAEKAHSWKLVVASPASNIPFIALRAGPRRDPAAICRDIDTSAARICYEELQVVAAQLPEN